MVSRRVEYVDLDGIMMRVRWGNCRGRLRIREEDEYHAPRGDDQIMTLKDWRSIIYRIRQSQGILPNIEKWGNIYKSHRQTKFFIHIASRKNVTHLPPFFMSIINILQHHTHTGITKIIPHKAYTR
jgi:hypothetical protein